MGCLEALLGLAPIAVMLLWAKLVMRLNERRDEEPYPRLPRPSQRDLQERGHRVAAALGGSFHALGYQGNHVVRFTAAGRPARLWWGRGMTVVMVDLRGLSPGALVIHPNEGSTGWSGYLGLDLRIGDRAFDKSYVVRARPEDLVVRLFTVERRAPLVSTMLRLRRFKRPTFDLGREALAVRVGQSLDDTGELLELCRTAESFAELLLEVSAADGAGISWGASTTAEGGECQVCGTGLASDVVRCAACRTPHHRDCWTYVGECSTYACRGTRFV